MSMDDLSPLEERWNKALREVPPSDCPGPEALVEFVKRGRRSRSYGTVLIHLGGCKLCQEVVLGLRELDQSMPRVSWWRRLAERPRATLWLVAGPIAATAVLLVAVLWLQRSNSLVARHDQTQDPLRGGASSDRPPREPGQRNPSPLVRNSGNEEGGPEVGISARRPQRNRGGYAVDLSQTLLASIATAARNFSFDGYRGGGTSPERFRPAEDDLENWLDSPIEGDWAIERPELDIRFAPDRATKRVVTLFVHNKSESDAFVVDHVGGRESGFRARLRPGFRLLRGQRFLLKVSAADAEGEISEVQWQLRILSLQEAKMVSLAREMESKFPLHAATAYFALGMYGSANRVCNLIAEIEDQGRQLPQPTSLKLQIAPAKWDDIREAIQEAYADRIKHPGEIVPPGLDLGK